MDIKQIGRSLAALTLALALALPLARPARADSDGQGNADGGGGSGSEQATSENTYWRGDRPQGMRVTIVNASTGATLAGPVDITNDNVNVDCHFGRVNKLAYKKGAALSLKIGSTYKKYTPDDPLPRIVELDDIEAAKSWFTETRHQQWLCNIMNYPYAKLKDPVKKREHKILFEPLVYVTYLNKVYAMTATEAAKFAQAKRDFRYHLNDLILGSLPLSAYLQWSDLGITAYQGPTTGTVTEAKVISQLGVGIIYFENEPGATPPTPPPDDSGRLGYDFVCSSVKTDSPWAEEEGKIRVSASVGYEQEIVCPHCHGYCPVCHNTGWITQMDEAGEPVLTPCTNPNCSLICDVCGGAGKVVYEPGMPGKAPTKPALVELYVEGASLDNKTQTEGKLLYSTTLTLTAGQPRNINNVLLNAGEDIGDKTVVARINWAGRTKEWNADNNRQEAYIGVEPATNLQVEYLPPNAPYRAGTDVITSFQVLNRDGGALRVRPKHYLDARFEAVNPDTGAVLATGVMEPISIPRGGTNLVYYKWHVPDDYAAGSVQLRCTINKNGGVYESNYADNTVTGVNRVQRPKPQIPPDTVFENTPAGFTKPTGYEPIPVGDLAASVLPGVRYERWGWNGSNATGWYAKESYSIQLTGESALTPDEQAISRQLAGGKWTMRSGYGVSLKVQGHVTANAPADAYTTLQNGNAYLPEFRYRLADGQYRTLEETAANVLEFPKNTHALDGAGATNLRRVHFVPLWYPDGDYQVKVYAYDLWTPLGMLSFTQNVPAVEIRGDMYDDWYVTHSARPK